MTMQSARRGVRTRRYGPAMSQPSRPPAADYLRAVAVESARLTDLLAVADPAARVPSCPDWDAADLLWHLAEVQWFWGSIAGRRLDAPRPAEADKPARPADHAGLVTLSRASTDRLVEALAAGSDSDPLWTWFEADRTRGFARRRQAHEALVHRLDAEQVVGAVTPLDPVLATDGVDEALAVTYGGTPSWGVFEARHGPVRLVATDTAASWLVDVGRLTGTVPDDGEEVDEGAVQLRAGDTGPVAQPVAEVAEVAADAGTLDAWLWGRLPAGAVMVSGDRAALVALAEAVGGEVS